jgi:metacaspase-1
MKIIIKTLSLLLSVLLAGQIVFGAQSPTQRKLALLVGVGDYDGNPWEERNGENSVRTMEAVIQKKFQFHREDVLTLTTPKKRFSMHLTDQSELDGSKIPLSAQLRTRFEDSNSPLSASARSVVEEAGRQWLIVDDENQRTFLIRKKAKWLNVYALSPLFHLDDAIGRTLDASTAIPAAARQAFADNAQPLSEQAILSVAQPGQRWVITEKHRKYVIRKSGLGEAWGVSESPIPPTRQNIIQSFRDHLIAQANPGDIVVFYFFGHGTQVLDDNGDELDSLDEALVALDNQLLRDDELSELLSALKEKSPANITVVIDSCFSGTATRAGRYPTLGRGYPGAKPQPNPRGKPDSVSGLLFSGQAKSADYILIAAARSDQPAKEDPDRNMGALTYHLAHLFEMATPTTTYLSLSDRLKAAFAANGQPSDPQLEGNLQKVVLGGTALPTPSYLLLTRKQKDDPQTFTVAAGHIHGMTVDSVFGIYGTETTNFVRGKELAKAKVFEVETMRSTLRLLPEHAHLATTLPTPARAVEFEHQFGDGRLKVIVEASVPDTQQLANALQKMPVVEFHGVMTEAEVERAALLVQASDEPLSVDYDIFIKPDASKKHRYLLQLADASPLVGVDTVEEIQRELEKLAWWQEIHALKNLDPNSKIKAELKIVPVKVRLNADKTAMEKVLGTLPEVRDEGGSLILKEGDTFQLHVRNTGQTDCYVNLIELKPDHTISIFFPPIDYEDFKGNETVKPDGKWHSLGTFWLKPPVPEGVHTHKLLLTATKTDLIYLFAAEEGTRERGFRGQGNDTALGRLLTALRAGQLRSRSATTEDWGTYSLSFAVQLRQPIE